MSYLVSLIGPAAVGKSTFGLWFIERNPLYVYVDIATFRQCYGVLNDNLSTEERLQREETVWNEIKNLINTAGYVIIESSGLISRLKTIYDLADKVCIVKFLADKSTLQERIKKRNNKFLNEELMSINKDIFDLAPIKADLTYCQPEKSNFHTIDNQIHLQLLKNHKAK